MTMKKPTKILIGAVASGAFSVIVNLLKSTSIFSKTQLSLTIPQFIQYSALNFGIYSIAGLVSLIFLKKDQFKAFLGMSLLLSLALSLYTLMTFPGTTILYGLVNVFARTTFATLIYMIVEEI